MENASKALIMAGGVLVGIAILSFMIYVFKTFGDTSKETEKRMSEREIEAFNSKFVGYETGGEHNLSDEIGYNELTGDSGEKMPTAGYKKYSQIFRDGSTTGLNEVYYRSLIAASQSLNTASDVVTAINDAIDINDENNNHYLYDNGNIEKQNSVEIIVDLGSDNKIKGNDGIEYQYLVIEPNKNVKAKYIYGFKNIEPNEDKNVNISNYINFEDSNSVKLYSILEKFRDTTTIVSEGRKYTVYKYYFFGEVLFNEKTSLVDSVRFKLIENKRFDDIITDQTKPKN